MKTGLDDGIPLPGPLKYKAYEVKGPDNDHSSEIVIAESPSKARSTAHKGGDADLNEYEFFELRAKRLPELDHLYETEGEGLVNWHKENVMMILRSLGWWFEDMSQCACCGLSVVESVEITHLDDDSECGECKNEAD